MKDKCVADVEVEHLAGGGGPDHRSVPRHSHRSRARRHSDVDGRVRGSAGAMVIDEIVRIDPLICKSSISAAWNVLGQASTIGHLGDRAAVPDAEM